MRGHPWQAIQDTSLQLDKDSGGTVSKGFSGDNQTDTHNSLLFLGNMMLQPGSGNTTSRMEKEPTFSLEMYSTSFVGHNENFRAQVKVGWQLPPSFWNMQLRLFWLHKKN